MARIEPPGGGGGGGPGAVVVVPFDAVAEVDVVHGLGREPMVQILQETTGGVFGFGGFGGGGFGTDPYFVPMAEANFTLYHIDSISFRLIMNNYYNGKILYV